MNFGDVMIWLTPYNVLSGASGKTAQALPSKLKLPAYMISNIHFPVLFCGVTQASIFFATTFRQLKIVLLETL